MTRRQKKLTVCVVVAVVNFAMGCFEPSQFFRITDAVIGGIAGSIAVMEWLQ